MFAGMIEQHLDLVTSDGTMNTFVVHPAQGGPHPVVLFYMDAPGKRDELHDMARRIAAAGYVVVLPNLYYRWRREFDLITGTSGETRTDMFDLMSQLTDAMVISDTETMFAWVDGEPAADGTRVGAVGYCMSGPFSFAVACTFPERISAAASIYGVRLFGDGSSASIADRAAAELYFACAEFDDYAPAEMVDGLEQHLASIGANARVERYPGVHHGFAFPLRPVYDQAAAERHWARLFDLFERNLQPTRGSQG
jgi:carboxymethylenebutenolidase